MPHRLPLRRQAELIRTGRLSPVELVDAHLRQIGKHNPTINAFVVRLDAEARAAARQAERKTRAAGPLHGVPVTVKDSFDIAGLPTLCGSKFRLGHRAEKDSTAAARLRTAGAIILGKTNCPEFLAYYETDNHITGRTNNPWDPERTAGGSSGGESAAIASFCSAGGIGSDGGGSIRIPAHFCGIAGLKPTPGRVSAAGHYPEIAHPGGLLGVAGPMARTADDVKLLFEVLAGYDYADPFSVPIELRPADLAGVRVGILEQFGDTPVEDAARAAVRKAAKLLGDLRILAEPFAPTGIEDAPRLWWFFFTELSAQFTREIIGGREQDAHWTGTELLNRVPRGLAIDSRMLVENLAARDHMRRVLLDQMERYPVLLMPVCAVHAYPHRRPGMDIIRAMDPVTPFNLLSLPAMVIPMDFAADGMPVGVQLVGRPYAEEQLLEVAVRLEECRGPLPAPPRYAG